MDRKEKQYKLHTQIPKPKLIGVGVLSVDQTGTAHFFEGIGDKGSQLLADMQRVRLGPSILCGLGAHLEQPSQGA